jgi:hydrogenase maturation protease
MQPRILVAGIGNIFHGDDAFGSEVARLLAQCPLSPEVRVIDFGIRGHDLALALQESYEAVILVDVMHRGGEPGTLCVIEPDLETIQDEATDEGISTHGMHPLRVLRSLLAQGCKLPPVWIVACEPATFGPSEGFMGLSEAVGAAVPEAASLIRALVAEWIDANVKAVQS